MSITIGLIGYGKFAQFIEQVLTKHLPEVNVKVHSRSNLPDGKRFFTLAEVCKCDYLIPTVPINAFENTIKDIRDLLAEQTVILEVCSVKMWPKQVMLEHLNPETQFICTHPMFGPESYKKSGGSLTGFKFVVENSRCRSEVYDKVIRFVSSLGVDVIEMSVEDHDRKAATFHFTTMFAGMMIRQSGLQRTEIDTASATKMHDFTEIVGDDLEILRDMYKYNPYCQDQLSKLLAAVDTVKAEILAN